MAREVSFVKGHGTRNDFVVVPDDSGEIELTSADISFICDRRGGVGGDGVLRVVLTEFLSNAELPSTESRFFMDYRNADGSIAEMCGNGARVFARFLWSTGREESSPFTFATRAGDVTATIHEDTTISITMGDVEVIEAPITVTHLGVSQKAVGLLAPNPHAVVWVDDMLQIGTLDTAPAVAPSEVFPCGVNVEFAHIDSPGLLTMRVYERGVGETQSCGTGACAVAVAAATESGFSGPWRVHVPGGELLVTIGEGVTLRGPAELVARGTVLLP